MQIIPVILTGGSRTRLSPLSRKEYPKQYLPLAGDNTILQETILHLKGIDGLERGVAKKYNSYMLSILNGRL
jgi:mannose-1-phosphate guanylyltransferase/mannose-6-phosphate isomerase